MDFMNMLQRSRLESKKISKTRAVTSVVPHEMDPHNVHIGPSDYVAFLTTASSPSCVLRAPRSAMCR